MAIGTNQLSAVATITGWVLQLTRGSYVPMFGIAGSAYLLALMASIFFSWASIF